MPSRFYLTDEDSNIAGYKRAKLDARSDTCSHVRAVTATATGPQSIPLTRVVDEGGSGEALQWISDPLSGPKLTTGLWQLRAWALESAAGANAGLRVDVVRFTNEEFTTVVTATSPELGVSTKDVAFTTGAATATELSLGDRLVIRLYVADAGGVMTTGQTVTVSYNGLYGRAEGDSYVICPDEVSLPNDISNEIVDTVRVMLRDKGQIYPQLEDDEVKKFIAQALNTYSTHSPRQVAAYISGDGQAFDFPLPGKWVWGFSRVVAIEHPADQQIPNMQDTIDWELREGILGPQPTRFIRFRRNVPESGVNNGWLLYTAKHEFSSEFSTLPSEDFDALLWLTCSYAAVYLASKGAGSTDSSLSADVVNYKDTESRWRAVANAFKALYMDRVVHPQSASPVGSTEDWDSMLSTGYPYLWHNRRIRRVR